MLKEGSINGGNDDRNMQPGVRKGPWTMEEDLILMNYIVANGEGAWNNLSRAAGLNRTGKSCRLRWLNYLRPDVRRGNITPEEQMLIVDLQSRWGNRWSKIAKHLPGRTDNEIKNFWRTKIQKKRGIQLGGGIVGYQNTAGLLVDDQASTNTSQTVSSVQGHDMNMAAAPGSYFDHQNYAVHGDVAGGGGGAPTNVTPEFLAAETSSDNFWAVDDFWPQLMQSLNGN